MKTISDKDFNVVVAEVKKIATLKGRDMAEANALRKLRLLAQKWAKRAKR